MDEIPGKSSGNNLPQRAKRSREITVMTLDKTGREKNGKAACATVQSTLIFTGTCGWWVKPGLLFKKKSILIS